MVDTTLPKVVMAFDFGTKKIGIAVGQSVTKTARPLETISAKNGVPDWHKVDALVKKWRPDAMVVGRPLNMDGTPQPLSDKASQFANHLKERYALPVHEVDERLTTKAAKEHLFNEGGYKALQHGQVDQVAAQLILETWFREKV